jgi:hypothetical protein
LAPQSSLGRVPTKSAGGTVYGGASGLPTSANVDAPLELSGSLTGMILSRGSPVQIQPKERRSRLTKVLLILVGVLMLVVVIGLVVATVAGDFVSAVLDGIING